MKPQKTPQPVSQLRKMELPRAYESECALIGKLIIDPHQVNEVVHVIAGAEDFYSSPNATIYAAIIELYDRDQEVAFDGLVQHLRDRKTLDQVGGPERLVELAESVPHASGIAYHAKIVREKAEIRSLIEVAEKVWATALTTADPAGEQLDAAEKMIFEIAQGQAKEGDKDFATVLHELYDQMAERDGATITGVPTGFTDLDNMLSGLQPGEMIIAAARPSMGKTAFSLNIAEHIAIVGEKPIGFFSLEMSKQALAQRLLSSRSGVDAQKIRRNQLSPTDWQALQVALGELTTAPIHIDDTPGLTLLQLRAKARRMAAKHQIEVVMIDYLQLMSSPATASQGRQQEVSELSRGVKALARELSVPVICLSQLNRGPEAREGHRPRMSDLRESGSIEQDADVVLMLHREDYFHHGEKDYMPTSIGEVIVTKQRNGPTGTVELVFDGSTTRFLNKAPDNCGQDGDWQ